jgi:hypothetical protein
MRSEGAAYDVVDETGREGMSLGFHSEQLLESDC